MDLFEAYPHLRDVPALRGRRLRLIALSGIGYDAQAFYFELADERFWARPPTGDIFIGVGGAQCRPDPATPPLEQLLSNVRRQWQCELAYFPAGIAYVLEEKPSQRAASKKSRSRHGKVAPPSPDPTLAAFTPLPASPTPFLTILTPPLLGGGDEVPDALAQAVYLIPLPTPPVSGRVPGILRIEQAALGEFLTPPTWTLEALQGQPWATLETARSLPPAAQLRAVLALRGLQRLWQAGVFPLKDSAHP